MTTQSPDQFLRAAAGYWSARISVLCDGDPINWGPLKLRTYNVFPLGTRDWSPTPGVMVSTSSTKLLATRGCAFYLYHGVAPVLTLSAFSLAGTDPRFLVLPKDTTPEAAWDAFVAAATLCGDLV